MEKRNMILLTVIAIATLLVAVVGATFAYFTASTTTAGTAPTTSVKTTELKGATVTFDGASSKFELLNYPGGLAVYGAKATIAKQQEGDTNDYEATFNLKIDYTNETESELDWELWMVESEYEDLKAAETTTCELHQKGEGNETQFWYSDKSEGDDNTQSCDAEAITTKLKSELTGTKLAHGKLEASKSNNSGHITKTDLSGDNQADDGDLTKRKINTSDKKAKYYYLVIKYPNSGEDQSPTDAGKTISATLSIDGEVASTIYSAGE